MTVDHTEKYNADSNMSGIGQNETQVKMVSTQIDFQFLLFTNYLLGDKGN